ncbi:hypothetical protein [Novosphingobium colocasiae]|uniref:Uncharacterized protein n=1 Tax=Novosphingobium colocasiae TaxID=1256513 RepID=A0A918PNW9_9SPHN|nr:hypothetical protein [Novosphingobium colocasiae]GGZ17427.1 hypothetical protein GCM10011614_34920 [Novosphingobium colocasiae]
MTDKIKTIEELAAGRNVELKIYTIKPGGWTNFFYYWRKIVKLRRAAGFKVEFAVADIPGNRFVWGVSTDGNFNSQNTDYLTSEDRIAANVISDYVAYSEFPKVVYIPVE